MMSRCEIGAICKRKVLGGNAQYSSAEILCQGNFRRHVTHIESKSKSTLPKSKSLELVRRQFPNHHDNAIMGRLHSNGKGISASAIPYSRAVPTWFKSSPEQVVENICKLAKKGATPSQIGVILRDSHGVAQVKVVTGKDHS